MSRHLILLLAVSRTETSLVSAAAVVNESTGVWETYRHGLTSGGPIGDARDQDMELGRAGDHKHPQSSDTDRCQIRNVGGRSCVGSRM